jgi:hypothetical protein
LLRTGRHKQTATNQNSNNGPQHLPPFFLFHYPGLLEADPATFTSFFDPPLKSESICGIFPFPTETFPTIGPDQRIRFIEFPGGGGNIGPRQVYY